MKTALMLQLCLQLRDKYNLCAVTNDIFTKEDGEFLTKHKALDAERIVAVETGGCPHAAIREDITANLIACEELTQKHKGCEIILLESGGDNLSAGYDVVSSFLFLIWSHIVIILYTPLFGL